MTLYTKSGQLPQHQYCYVERKFLNRELTGVEPCVWFGLVSQVGRMWGCHILLQSGAVYRGLPPHALTWAAPPTPFPEWTPAQAQRWDCYGRQFSTICYDTLAGLDVVARIGDHDEAEGSYLFTAVPIGDPYSEVPDQDKEFVFVRLDNGRLTIQPTNRVLFRDKSFTDRSASWPEHLRPLDTIWHCE